MYTAIIYKDYDKIEQLLDEGFDINTIIMPRSNLTALGIESCNNVRNGSVFRSSRVNSLSNSKRCRLRI